MELETFAYCIPISVGPEDIDELDHVNNVVYLGFVERIAREHASLLGFDFLSMKNMGGAFVARQHVITYLRPALLGEHLEIWTRIASVNGPRTVRETEIRRDGQVLVTASTEWVWIDFETRRPKRVPSSFVDMLPNQAIASPF